MDEHLLYLSEADVASAAISPDRLREAVAAAFAAKARGTAHAATKSVLTLGPGHVFQAKPGVLREAGLAGMKWFGLVPSAQTSGPTIASLLLLADAATGTPLVIMGANGITATRTGAMTAIAAQSLARPDSTSIGFIGCGVQAYSHFEALRRVLPRLGSVIAYSRTAASAERFAAAARDTGLQAKVTNVPREAVDGLDVVVTSVPEGAIVAPFLDPVWLAPGAFASAVDLGRSWNPDNFRAVDILVTDEHEQTRVLAAAGRMSYAGPYAADLAELAAGKFAGRRTATQRAMFIFSGHALADLAAAQVVYETALQRGLGTKLPR